MILCFFNFKSLCLKINLKFPLFNPFLIILNLFLNLYYLIIIYICLFINNIFHIDIKNLLLSIL